MLRQTPQRMGRMFQGNWPTNALVRYLHQRYVTSTYKREFLSRIKSLDASAYLDTNKRPNLNVIILVVDCLRNRQLSCQGYPRKTTPFFDSFPLRKSAISASCWTYPSVASILTGLYPHNHRATIVGKTKNFDELSNFRRMSGPIITMPEMFFLLGYETYFATAIDPAFYSLKGRVLPKRYDLNTKAKDLLSDLAKWIAKKRDTPFFAYLQLGDLHEPLIPPNDFRNFFAHVEDIPKLDFWSFRTMEEQHGQDFQRYRENKVLLYDNALRYVDHAVEMFYSKLEVLGLVDSTLFVVTADHGEEFWEHASLEAACFFDPRGYYGVGHGHNVFNEVIQVPLLLTGPNILDERGSFPCSTVDIVPTILDLLQVDHYLELDGRSILEQETHAPLLSEASGYGYEKKALIDGALKLLYSKYDGVAWVFDLEKDPNELHPIDDKNMVSTLIDRLAQVSVRDEKQRIRRAIKKISLRSS